MFKLTIIAAVAENGVIGKDGAMPWGMAYKKDLKRFKELTKGNIVLCGRKTWESITEATGKPFLPNRQMIVVSSTVKSGCAQSYDDDIIIRPDLDQAIACAKAVKFMAKEEGRDCKVFVIGGGRLYQQTLPLATKLELTIIEKEYDGDVYFPEYPEGIRKDFKLKEVEQEEGYRFETYKRLSTVSSSF